MYALCVLYVSCNYNSYTTGNFVPLTWTKPIMENLNVPWNAQNWPSMAILISDLLYGTVHQPS